MIEVDHVVRMLRRLRQPYTDKHLGSVLRLRSLETQDFIPGAPPDVTAPPPGCRFHLRCPVSFEKCGWSAEEFIAQMDLLQSSGEAKDKVPSIASMSAKSPTSLLIKPGANGSVSDFVQKLNAFVAATSEKNRFLKSIESVQGKTKSVEVKLYETTPPPIVGTEWRAACWLVTEGAA